MVYIPQGGKVRVVRGPSSLGEMLEEKGTCGLNGHGSTCTGRGVVRTKGDTPGTASAKG